MRKDAFDIKIGRIRTVNIPHNLIQTTRRRLKQHSTSDPNSINPINK